VGRLRSLLASFERQDSFFPVPPDDGNANEEEACEGEEDDDSNANEEANENEEEADENEEEAGGSEDEADNSSDEADQIEYDAGVDADDPEEKAEHIVGLEDKLDAATRKSRSLFNSKKQRGGKQKLFAGDQTCLMVYNMLKNMPMFAGVTRF